MDPLGFSWLGCENYIKEPSICVHLRICGAGFEPWALSVIYPNPYYQRRRSLWEELINFLDDINGPREAIGDYNVVLHKHEQRRNHTRSFLGSMEAFQMVVN